MLASFRTRTPATYEMEEEKYEDEKHVFRSEIKMAFLKSTLQPSASRWLPGLPIEKEIEAKNSLP
jgi:hypothetical protein